MEAIDMTHGRPAGLLLRFAIPLALGSLCQILYTVADGTVVGRLVGIDAFAAIGAANFLSLLAYGMILGLTQGFGVLFAQLFGGQDRDGLCRSVAMAIILSAAISVVLTTAGLLFARPVLVLMDTPREILSMTEMYVYWICCS